MHSKTKRIDSKDTILNFLKKNPDKILSISDLSRELNMSQNTVSKWIEVLKVENRIYVEDKGNIKILKWLK